MKLMIPNELTQAFHSPSFQHAIELIENGINIVGIEEETGRNILHIVHANLNCRQPLNEVERVIAIIHEKLGNQLYNEYLMMEDFQKISPIDCLKVNIPKPIFQLFINHLHTMPKSAH
ncbi:MAG: hypothetical protein ChlgKO_11840 [Chlamydiales bacterium]